MARVLLRHAVAAMATAAVACGPADPPPVNGTAPPFSPASPGDAGGPIAWRPIDPPAKGGALASRIQKVGGTLHVTWLEPSQATARKTAGAPSRDDKGGRRVEHTLFHSRWVDSEWTPPVPIQSGDDFFANWADVPGLATDADGTYYAHALRKLGEGTYAYGVRLSTSEDGRTWRDAGWLHDDASATEHGFVSYIAASDGAVRAIWLDGRAMLDSGAMHLRTAKLRGGSPAASELLDERVCECCSTDAVLTADGPVVAYRDRSDREIRDIAVVRATADGWTEPIVAHDDGWSLQGCPVNGPALAAKGRDVALAWFTAAQDRPRVQVAFSRDAGASWGAPFLLDDQAPLGRVDVVFDDTGDAQVLWLAQRDGRAEVSLQRIGPDGAVGELRVLATTEAGRAAGVPKLEVVEEGLIAAWIETGDSATLRAALIPAE
ncbi:MAG: sialidase family protein [Acidobacteriota bacterium]